MCLLVWDKISIISKYYFMDIEDIKDGDYYGINMEPDSADR